MLAHAASAATVTVMPPLMMTVSPATGTDEPPHVAVLPQLPVTEAVRVAAWAFPHAASRHKMETKHVMMADRLLKFLIPRFSFIISSE